MLRRSIESLETERARDKANINRLQQEVDKLRIVSAAIIVTCAQGYKTFSCSTQLSLKFILLINVKMPTIVGILTFIRWYFNIY